MTTWNEILDIKLGKIQAANASKSKKQKRKKNFGCFGWGLVLLLAIFGLANLFDTEEPNFDKFKIGSEVLYKTNLGDIELYQLGERKLSQTEQKNSEYKKTTAPQFERTNIISEKYFIDNSTDKIGKVLDTIPSMDGHLWLKLKLDEQIYRKPIDFNLISDEFSEKLKIEKSYIMTENLSKNFYVRLCNINKSE